MHDKVRSLWPVELGRRVIKAWERLRIIVLLDEAADSQLCVWKRMMRIVLYISLTRGGHSSHTCSQHASSGMIMVMTSFPPPFLSQLLRKEDSPCDFQMSHM